MSTSAENGEGRRTAIQAEALFLANFLLLPGIAFLLLLLLHFRHRQSRSPLARLHLRETLSASIAGGALLLGGTAVALLAIGPDEPDAWAVALTWFVSCHAALVMWGALGLARAMAGRPWGFPYPSDAVRR